VTGDRRLLYLAAASIAGVACGVVVVVVTLLYFA
jgi:tetrahydromethanopterin S-methyltransferase subunit F